MHEPHQVLESAPIAPPPAAEPVTLGGVAREVAAMLRRPAPILPPSRRPWLVLWRMVALYFIAMLLTGPLTLLGTKLSGAEHGMEEMRRNMERFGGPAGLLMMASVIAPLWEETAFRLPLAPFRPWRLLPALALLSLLLGNGALATLMTGVAPPPSAWWPFSAAGALSVPIIAALFSPPWRAQMEAWWRRNFRLVLLASVLAFGFAHAGNYHFSSSNPAAFALVPLLVLPQLVAGVLLAYVRIKLGFWFGVLLHSGVNTVLMISVILSPPEAAKPRPGAAPAQRTPAPALSPASSPSRRAPAERPEPAAAR